MTRLSALRAAYGTALLVAPVRGRAARWFCRVLGVRQVAEATVLARHASRPFVAAGGAVDGIHAVTMMWAARRSPRHRAGLHASAAVATGLAVEALWRCR